MTLETPLRGMHAGASASVGEYFGVRLPSRYGDFAAEYVALREGVGLVDSNFRAFFSLTGPDRQRYLNAILTSNVRDLTPGRGVVGLLLTPQGHILAEVEAFSRSDSILTSSHAIVRERTFATLDKFIIMDDVTLTDITDSTGTLDLIGPKTALLLAELGMPDFGEMPLLSHERLKIGQIACGVVRSDVSGLPAARLVCKREDLPVVWRELEGRVKKLGGAPVGMEALNSVRLESGAPWFGVDYGDQQIPHEAGLEHSHISYEKGCYTGQEIVERVRSRGHVNRRLTELRFSGSAAPAAGTRLLHEGTEVGNVTSAAFSPSLGGLIGLGYVRRERSAIGTILDASGIPAEVIAPPFARTAAKSAQDSQLN